MNHAVVNDEMSQWVTCITVGGARPAVGPSALRLLDICRSTLPLLLWAEECGEEESHAAPGAL